MHGDFSLLVFISGNKAHRCPAQIGFQGSDFPFMRLPYRAARTTLLPGREMLYCLSSSRRIVPVAAVVEWSVGEWLSLVEHLVRDQGVGGSNPLSPTNSKGLIGTHVGRNWAQFRECEAQPHPLCRDCTEYSVYLHPGASVALRDVLVRVTHPNVNEDLRHQLFIEVSRSKSPEGMEAARWLSHL